MPIDRLLMSASRFLLQARVPRPVKSWVLYCVASPRFYRNRRFQVKTSYGDWFAGTTDDLIPSTIYYFGIWEPAISEYMKSCLQPGDVVVDVGANQGWYTILASGCVGPAGRVIAIEASSPMVDALRTNIAINEASNVSVIHAAAWNRSEQAAVYAGPAGNRGKTTLCPGFQDRQSSPPSEMVSARPLDELVPEELWNRIRFVKIDVEGAEWEVLDGMQRLSQALPPAAEILIEVSPDEYPKKGHHHAQMLEPLERLGFNAYRIGNEYTPEFYLDFCVSRRAARPRALTEPLLTQSDLVLSRRGSDSL